MVNNGYVFFYSTIISEILGETACLRDNTSLSILCSYVAICSWDGCIFYLLYFSM